MNKNRIKKLETKIEQRQEIAIGVPTAWRPERGKIAIGESPFILDRLKELGREIVYSPYVFSAVLVEEIDREIIDRIEGKDLYLKGVKSPIFGITELIFK
jgi:hypothetical protein